ncbi:MAG: glycosyltransferase family 2 protein [Bacteroidota bacterium]
MNTTTLPKISIVTPSYNQAQFIEDTMQSVLGQRYPNLEYIVMDGGSNDGSADLIQRCEDQLAHWQSAKDDGQAAAINEGFALATGDILAWLNSDDMYMPGALKHIAALLDVSKPQIAFGNCIHIHHEKHTAWGSKVPQRHATLDLRAYDYLIQPSCFWTRKAWETTGQLNTDLNFSFDWDWFLRAQQKQVTFIPTPEYLSCYRIHSEHKTGTGGHKRIEELTHILQTYHSLTLAEAYQRWWKDWRVDKARKLLHMTGLNKWNSADKLLHQLFFRDIPYTNYQLIKTA